MTPLRHEPDPRVRGDNPDEYEHWLFVRAKMMERGTAVDDLARVYAALGVLTCEEAMMEVKRLKSYERAFKTLVERMGNQ